jgi:hypothetical protein
MRSLRRSSQCYWSSVDCDGQVTVVEVADSVAVWKTIESACSSLGLAQWGVLFSEAQ